ncbi:uncharacterized protein B0H18DRAFT_1048009 [Fomitopsis serialis]|uniref:uncharacterized protein n=1 Tax=Fomitopsis serialis TaxID=139415 RepID=UPI0020075FD6|nr:uncharacterized protein B0H18DRAFT_1048009 [Neoantrodia serialis]KAH9913523.1 hypothetical protein B0H18DRAFT_1048009 [Neoantrodia serialis]
MPEIFPTTSPSTSSWLQEHFRTLVTAPNDHFDKLFTRDATGVVAGKSVGRDGIKAALLALHTEWNATSCRFGPATCLDGFVRSSCLTPTLMVTNYLPLQVATHCETDAPSPEYKVKAAQSA